MTQIEREDLVERYLAGEMNPAQEAEFFLHVAVDDELQRTLKAFRIMDRAISNEREAVIGERSRYREHIMAMLAVTPAVITDGGVAGTAASSGSAGTAGTVAGLGAWKTALIAIVAGGVAAGTAVVVIPRIIGGDEPAPAVRTVSPGDLPRMEAPSLQQEQAPQQVLPNEVQEAKEENNAERNDGTAASISVRKSRQPVGGQAAGIRQATSPDAAPATKAGRKDSGSYVKLPEKSPEEVKIPTEVTRPRSENP